MKCGNEECDYDLFLQEVGFVICPKCGGTIRANLRPEYFNKMFLTGRMDELRSDIRLWERLETLLRFSPFILFILVQIFVFGPGGDAIVEERAFRETLPDIQFLRELQAVIGMTILCIVLDKGYNQLRVIVSARSWYRSIVPHMVIKTLGYAAIVAYMYSAHVPDFVAFLNAAQPDTYYSPGRIEFGLTMSRFWYIGFIWWTVIANFIAETIDTVNEHRIFHLNEIVIGRHLENPR